mmetsp:Transcript_17876/g.39211  ORF Transcript_17876/g.39211 Transcript_17876/m.39211 type:complete len:403 (-) Transcript_17876:155-1363(-)
MVDGLRDLLLVGIAALVHYTETVGALKAGVAPADNPYSKVQAIPAGESGVSAKDAQASQLYLVASFPDSMQVAYCKLPDNVWRPLVVGNVSKPTALAIDMPHSRLFVSDEPASKIYWYTLSVRPNGLLQTTGEQHVAVDKVAAHWMAVNGVGDLYFTGKALVDPPKSTYDAVFRHDASQIESGNSYINPESAVYSRDDTSLGAAGGGQPAVWMPSGIAVDSFEVYWGNQELGGLHGSINKGPRKNIGVTTGAVRSLNMATDEVRGMASTGTNIFYVTPKGVFGQEKSAATVVTDPAAGLIAPPPADDTNGVPFDLKSIAWDGDGTAYLTNYAAGGPSGVIYSIPAVNTLRHDLTKFVDAPGVWGIALMNFEMASGTSRMAPSAMLLVLFTVTITSLAALMQP